MPTPWSRRSFVAGAGSAALALGMGAFGAGAALTAPAHAAEGDEVDGLRAKWRDILLGTGVDASVEPFKSKLAALGTTARGYGSAMAPGDASLWPDLPFSGTDSLATNYVRLNTMAQAYLQPGTGLTGDKAFAARIVEGAEHVYTKVFNPATKPYGNGWHWDIGSPIQLADLCVLMYDDLSADQLAKYTASIDHFSPVSRIPDATGANLTDKCRILAVRAIAGKNPEKLAQVGGFLSPLFPYVTSGDGLYVDGSFVQHKYVPYTGSYGAVMLGGLSRLLALLGGTTWEVTDPGVQNILGAIDNAFAPFLYNGLLLDSVNGRSITRRSNGYQGRGHSMLNSVLLMADGASAKDAARWRGMVKGWLTRDAAHSYVDNPSLDVVTLARLKAVVDDTAIPATPEPVAHRLFPSMDRAVHRRRGWAASLSMYSSRIQPYEQLNGENLQGWHTGSGFLQWYLDDGRGDQYAEAFWPTVDRYRLPGTTVTKKRLADGAGGGWGWGLTDKPWVGGTTDGEFAAIGQHLEGVESTLVAKKSWFCLDDSLVCLGAGITATDGQITETVIDNRNLGTAGTNALTIDGRRQPLEQGWSSVHDEVGWAHIEGHGGYVFPGRASLKALREERTGAWKDINTGQPADSYTHRYLTLWADHGTDPTDADYAYILMPGARAADTARRAHEKHWLKVLANTPDQQGIQVPGLRVTAVNFWNPGTLGKLTVDIPASVLIREHRDGTATLCVSDPTQLATSLELTWNRPVRSVISKPSTVTGATTGSTLKLTLTGLGGTAGATQKIKVRLG
ncbi:polysaccharide lyase 8 family protein [Streptomyces mesophilus]|uniref:polysaccharide lyase 8 family protein n=1 Tax=Streptomyces mesophilus TaxID=1775132 RepID=UPI003319DC4D